MKSIEKSITVDVPVSRAYNQWTQFEDFPRFMEGVKEVRQLDDLCLHWRAEIGGKLEEWDAEILEQVPDKYIAWRSVNGARNAGRISFSSLTPNQTKVELQLDYEPVGVLENVGDVFGVVSARVAADLERFKKFVETHPAAAGGWRGEVHNSVKEPRPRL